MAADDHVGRTAASASYRTGALPFGQWYVMLGLYETSPGYVRVHVSAADGSGGAVTNPVYVAIR